MNDMLLKSIYQVLPKAPPKDVGEGHEKYTDAVTRWEPLAKEMKQNETLIAQIVELSEIIYDAGIKPRETLQIFENSRTLDINLIAHGYAEKRLETFDADEYKRANEELSQHLKTAKHADQVRKFARAIESNKRTIAFWSRPWEEIMNDQDLHEMMRKEGFMDEIKFMDFNLPADEKKQVNRLLQYSKISHNLEQCYLVNPPEIFIFKDKEDIPRKTPKYFREWGSFWIDHGHWFFEYARHMKNPDNAGQA